MNFIEIDTVKLPAKHGHLKAYIDQLNETRETPVTAVMLVEDDLPRGMVIFSRCGQLLELFVAPEVRRVGIGTQLYTYYINNIGQNTPTANVDPDNVEGQHFLLHHGWRIHGKIKPLYHESWHLRMTRKPTVTRYQPHQGELACAEFLEGTMVFFAVGKKLY